MSATVTSNSPELSSSYDSKKENIVNNSKENSKESISSSSLSDVSHTETPTITLSDDTNKTAKTIPTQWICIQAPTKVTLANNTINKCSNINLLNGGLTQVQISKNKNSLISNINIPKNQGVFLAQSINNSTLKHNIVFQKTTRSIQTIPVVSTSLTTNAASKSTLVHLTMVKPKETSKLTQLSGLTRIKPSECVYATSNSNLSNPKQFVISSMPKLITNRLPITATTNSVKPKFTYLPMSALTTSTNNSSNSKPKTINFKLSDGQLKETSNGKVQRRLSVIDIRGNQKSKMFNFKIANGVLQEGDNKVTLNKNEKDKVSPDKERNQNLECNEVMTDDENDKKRHSGAEDRYYELSIVEPDTGGTNDIIVPIKDEEDKSKKRSNKQLKEPQKFVKHGVSILKKSISFSDRKTEQNNSSLIISPLPNPITNVSDNKETNTSSENCEKTDSSKNPSPKGERRRKSTFTCRQDYDDVIVSEMDNWKESKLPFDTYKQFENSDVMLTKLDEDGCYRKTKIKVEVEDKIEIKLIKDDIKEEQPENNDIYNSDITDILTWEEGIGTLPGSELKFHVNEYGLLEYLTREEWKELLANKKTEQNEIKLKKEQELCCAECGCYGVRYDFVSSQYCSYECQKVGQKKKHHLEVKKKKVLAKKNVNNFLQKIEEIDQLPPSEDEHHNTSNENSTDKFNYPWNCSKKGFSWSKYLDHIKAKAAPVKLFKDPFPYSKNGFRQGMKLEGVDPQHPSHFCVLTVAEVVGYRIRLHFDGYPENYDFWVNADSMNIFPAGWCEKFGHVLHPPPGYNGVDFNWNNYLKQTKCVAAPRQLFINRAGNTLCPNGFRIGMKLEAIDRKNTSLICVATIADMMDNRLLIHFDNWNDIYDYWVDPTSPHIHPVGWCDEYGHNLTPPSGYPDPETFTWEKYLKETKSVAAPARAFKQRGACGFKKSMRLEAVDKRVPQLIRVATVDDVRDHQIRIRFDGWPDRYNFWVDDNSTEIHPVGWCHKTGHPIEPPLTPDDVYDFLECPTVGCRGVGNIKGPRYSSHTIQKHCPYAEENIDKDNVLPDRLLSPGIHVEAVVPVSVPVSKDMKDTKEKTTQIERKIKTVSNAKIPKLESNNKFNWSNNIETEEWKPTRKFAKKRCKSSLSVGNGETVSEKTAENFTHKNNFLTSIPTSDPTWLKHAKYLRQFIRNETDPRDWSSKDVVDFFTSFPACSEHFTELIHKQNIDGEAFLMLKLEDLTDILKFKLGPAIKLYNAILLMRQNVFSV